MKKILTAMAGLCAMAGTLAHAAPLVTKVHSASNPYVVSVYVNGDTLNDGFDTIIFDAVADPGTQFSTVNTGSPASPRLPGDPSTFINRMLDQDPAEVPGALGWTRLGVINTPARVAFTAGPLGGKITTPAAPGLFLANFLLVPGKSGVVSVQLVNAGVIAYEQRFHFIEPEPSSSCLVALALLPLAMLRRRGS